MFRIVFSHNPDRPSKVKDTIEKAQKYAEKFNEPAGIYTKDGVLTSVYFGPGHGWHYVH